MSKCCVYYDADANRCDYHDPISFKLGAENRQLHRERDTLTHRIDELCAENERLRQEREVVGMAAYELGRKSMADENAKLRELAEELFKLADRGLMELGDDDFRRIVDEAEKLGIEVDG